MKPTALDTDDDDQALVDRRSRSIATIHLAFAFDIGDEIDLDRARLILQGEPGQVTPPAADARIDSATGRRRFESSSSRPEFELPGEWSFRGAPRGELTLFDFGAISLSVRFPVDDDTRGSPDAGRRAGRAGPADRRRPSAPRPVARADPARRLRLRRQRHERGVHRLSTLGSPRGDWLAERADWIAGLVRLESEPLSAGRGSRGHPA